MIDGWADLPEDGDAGELGLFARVRAIADWAIEGFANGTIDRFSIGAIPQGEVTCTVHDCPVWTDCYCWPGMEVGGPCATAGRLGGVSAPPCETPGSRAWSSLATRSALS
jgi:hypothetical protein